MLFAFFVVQMTFCSGVSNKFVQFVAEAVLDLMIAPSLEHPPTTHYPSLNSQDSWYNYDND